MKQEINLYFVMQEIKRKAALILLVGIVFMGIAFAAAKVSGENYYAKISYYTINSEEGKKTVDASLVSAAQALAKDYVKIAESDLLMRRVAEELNRAEETDIYTIEQAAEMIEAETLPNSSVFTITVKGKDKDRVSVATKAVAENFEDIISDAVKRDGAIFKLSLEQGSEAPKTNRDELIKDLAAGLAIGVLAASIFVVVRAAAPEKEQKKR